MMAMTLHADTTEHALLRYPEVHFFPLDFEIQGAQRTPGHEMFTHVNKPRYPQHVHSIWMRVQDRSDAARRDIAVLVEPNRLSARSMVAGTRLEVDFAVHEAVNH